MWTKTGPRRQRISNTGAVKSSRQAGKAGKDQETAECVRRSAHRTQASAKKLDENKETIPYEAVSHECWTALQQTMMAEKMNQAQLARVQREGCHHQGMRAWHGDPERCDHLQSVGEMTLSTAKDPLHSPNNDSQAELTGKLALGCERYHLNNQVGMSHDVACRQHMAVWLCHLNNVQKEPETEDTPVAMDTRQEPASSSTQSQWHQDMTDFY